jgi:hypothetical protein
VSERKPILIHLGQSEVIEKKTLMEVWSDSHSDYYQLKVFGCTTYVHVNNVKLEPRAVKCVFWVIVQGSKDISCRTLKLKGAC